MITPIEAQLDLLFLNQWSPYIPLHWPTGNRDTYSATFKAQQAAANQTHSLIPLLLTNDSPALSTSIGFPNIKIKGFLESMASNPEACRQNILNGDLTPTAPERKLRADSDPKVRQEVLNLKESRETLFATLKELFPGVSLPPALRHIWDHHHTWLWLNHDSFWSELVGYNPYLIFNFYPVQKMLFSYAVEAKRELPQIVCEKLEAFDEGARKQFGALMALKIIQHSFPSGSQDTLIVEYLNQKEVSYTSIDHNSFALGDHNARDRRSFSNEPRLTRDLWDSLTVNEQQELLAYCLSPQQQPLTNPRVRAVYDQLEEMGKALVQRYFGANDPGRQALPARFSNQGLCEMMISDYQEADNIYRATNALTTVKGVQSAFVPKASQYAELTHLRKSIKVSKFQKNLWKGYAKTSLWQDHLNTDFLIRQTLDLSFDLPLTEATKKSIRSKVLTPLALEAQTIVTLSLLLQKIANSDNGLEELIKNKAIILIDRLPHDQKVLLFRVAGLTNGERGRHLRQLFAQSKYLAGYASEKHWLQFSNQEYLESARMVARRLWEEKHDLSQFGLTIDHPEYVLEEWIRFIDWRQEQLNHGREVELPYYYQPNSSEAGSFYYSPQNFAPNTTGFVYSNILNLFPNECVADPQDVNRFEILMQQHGVLNGMTYNMPKSKIGRSFAVYVVGPQNDFSALIPQVILPVAKLDHAFMSGTFADIISKNSHINETQQTDPSNKGKEKEKDIQEIFSSDEDSSEITSNSNSLSSRDDNDELNTFSYSPDPSLYWTQQEDDGMMDWLTGKSLRASTDFLDPFSSDSRL